MRWLFDKFLLGMTIISSGMIIVVLLNPPSNAQILEIPDFNRFPPRRHIEHQYDIRSSLGDLEADYSRAENGSVEEWTICNEIVDFALEAYVKDWPQFMQAAQDDGWRAAWADHFAKRHYRGVIACFLVDPLVAKLVKSSAFGVMPEDHNEVPRWCGRWREGVVFDEHDRALQKLIPLAFYWSIPSAVRFFSVKAMTHNYFGWEDYAINPDVHYYLLARSRVRQDRENYIFPMRLEPGQMELALLHTLTAQQKQSLTNAAIAGDYQSVFDKTPQCRPRKEMVTQGGLVLDKHGWIRDYTELGEPRDPNAKR